MKLRVAGRDRRLDVALMPERRDRDEDGLLPTSMFKSVLISPIEGVVVVDGELTVSSEVEKKSLVCRP